MRVTEPAMMRAAVLHGPGDVQIEERTVPRPTGGDALIRVSSVGVCGSDIHYFRNGRIGDHAATAPIVLGHECSGVVVSAPLNATHLRPGIRVAIEPQRPCGRCRYCVSGAYNICRTMRFFADPPTDGALAEFVLVPAAFCHPVPDSISDDESALIEPLAVGIWALQRARLAVGETVLVSGAGPIGVLAAQAALAMGAGRVVVTDVNAARLEFVRSFGAATLDLVSSSYDEVAEVDVLVECSGAPGSIAAAAQTMNPRGRIAAVGIGRTPLTEIDLLHLQSHELELVGVYRYADVYPRAIALVSRGAVNLRSLITHRFPLERAAEALALSETDLSAIKAIVRPGEYR